MANGMFVTNLQRVTLTCGVCMSSTTWLNRFLVQRPQMYQGFAMSQLKVYASESTCSKRASNIILIKKE